jgi:hypothetical protein
MLTITQHISRTRKATLSLVRASAALLVLVALALATLLVSASWGSSARRVAHHHEVAVHERAHLRLIRKHSGLLYEHGVFSGTPGGSITVQIRVSYTKSKLWFRYKPPGGAVSGSGWASFYAEGPVAHFRGSVAVNQGTGRYSGARAQSLHIAGTIQRHTFAISLTVLGSIDV